jgi:flagellin
MANMINTNITSLNAQNNLNKSQSSLATSLQRLSTGLRINSAKDDAAGMAIASRMSAQISGMGQASRNANDAISMSQTAESAMGQVGDILLRMRDLSVQSANGSNSTDDRKTIQNEVDQLTSEIDRISGSTEFNGSKLLDGSKTNNSFQIGANANQTIDFKIAEVSTKSMSLNSTTALGDLNSGRIDTPTGGANTVTINGTDIGMAAGDDTAAKQATAINAQSGTTGVTATAYNSVQGTAGQSGITDGTMTINGATIKASGSMSELVENINKQAGGVTASIGSNGGLSLTNDDGADIVIGGTSGTSTAGSGLTAGTAGADKTYSGYVSLTSGDGSDIVIGGTDLTGTGFNASTGSGSVTGTQTTATELLATDGVKINNVAIGASASDNAADKAAAINAVKTQTGVSATASTKVSNAVDMSDMAAYSFNGDGSDQKINGVAVDFTGATNVADVVTKINDAGIQGVTASTNAKGELELNSATGLDINITAGTASTDILIDGTTKGKISLTSDSGGAIQITDTTAGAGLATLGLVAQGGNSEAVGGKLDVSTQANAQSAIARIDSAISFIGTQRSTMGAVQNRLGMAISNLASSSENMTAARSRIQDADFATESANLTRGQILQQAGTAMLAQANSLPNGVMALLR